MTAPTQGPGYNRAPIGYYRWGTRDIGTKIERKFHDVTHATNTVIAGGEINELSLNLIGQGNTESKRIGRRITVHKLYFTFVIQMPAQATTVAPPISSDIIRVIIYLDTQCNGATAQIAHIVETNTIASYRNLANQERFVILMDQDFPITTATSFWRTTATVGYETSSYVYHVHKSFNVDTKISFDNTLPDGEITTIRENNFGVYAITSNGKAQLGFEARLRFTD